MAAVSSSSQVPPDRIDVDEIERLYRRLLTLVGEDPDRPGLIGTPRRVAEFWREFVCYDPGNTDVTFESVTTDQLVVVKGIRVYSLCEHHLLPFWADVSIGYIAKRQVLGLSKFARIAKQFAHRLQLQERLVDEIGAEVSRLTQSPDVAVVASGVHLCMIMRGIKTDATMISSSMRGVFFDNPDPQREFLSLAGVK